MLSLETLAALRAFHTVGLRPNLFNIGDIVTPRPGSAFGMQDALYLVVSCRLPAFMMDLGDPGSAAYGARFDVRIATIVHGTAFCY